MRNGDNSLKTFCINYIEINILPIFKKKNLRESEREILIYNIETIAQCCGLEKNCFDGFYPKLFKKKEIPRKRSVEALKRFRKEFNNSKEHSTCESIINRLEDNNVYIFNTFQRIYGT